MNELEKVAAAFDRKDYRQAAQLLKPLYQKSPQDPWVIFYIARLQEVNNKAEAAEKFYRQVMRETTIPKLLAQARQGLQRIQNNEENKRKQAIAEAKNDPNNIGIGALILEPINNEDRKEAAQKFGRIMKLDPYNARQFLQSRGWRLYRTGNIGELRVYSQELREANIPTFCAALTDIKKIKVFRVNYFTAADRQATVVCQNENNELGSVNFNWSEIAWRVEGLLPIFKEVVTSDYRSRDKIKWKEITHDYAKVWDLHLPARRCIIRLCDLTYQFQEGIKFVTQQQEKGIQLNHATNRIKWNNLLTHINPKLSKIPIWSEFTPFAETALDYPDFLEQITPYIDVFRREDTLWDSAFQLYTGLVYLKNTSTTMTSNKNK